MSKRILRFGFHGFLNALPLLRPLRRRSQQAGFEMVVDVPSALATDLMAGRLDLAMVPSIEYLRADKGFRLLPGICIASQGDVLSVLLIAKTPLAEVRSLALDNRSRTSVALLRILFGDRFHPEVGFYPVAPDIAGMLNNYDAALIIGDPALSVAKHSKGMKVYDLSGEWFARTGKTFVHAVVAVRPGTILTEEIMDAVRAASSDAPTEISEIAKTHAEKYGVETQICEDYLRHRIRYNFGDEELDGLTFFRDLSYEHGLIPQKHPIHFV